jgi:hypothetical protein
MSFVTVFTASAMGFALLVPLLMVLVLLVYGGPGRTTGATLTRTPADRDPQTVAERTEVTRRVA